MNNFKLNNFLYEYKCKLFIGGYWKVWEELVNIVFNKSFKY